MVLERSRPRLATKYLGGSRLKITTEIYPRFHLWTSVIIVEDLLLAAHGTTRRQHFPLTQMRRLAT